MTIQETAKQLLKTAMLEKNESAKSILRVLLGEFNRIGKEVSDPEATAIIKKMVQNANDQNNTSEATFLENFLPQQLSYEELSSIIQSKIESAGLSSMRDMGVVMGYLKSEYAGQYDGKAASQIVKEKLS